MLNSLSKDSSLYKYLDRDCRWLLEPLKEGRASQNQSINIRFSPPTWAWPGMASPARRRFCFN